MLDGRASLNIFDQQLASAKDALNGLHGRMAQLNSRLDAGRRDLADQYRALARVRLDDLTAQRLIGRLDQTHQAVMKLLAQKEAAVKELDRRVANSVTRLGGFGGQREALQDQRDQALEAVDDQLAAVETDLAGQADYQQRKAHWETADAQAAQASAKAEQAQVDRETKGRPYEADDLFMYLWQRRYTTPDYAGRGLVRSLDGWVARLVHYEENRANYHMLTLLPVRLKEHAQKLQQEAARLQRELEEQEQKAAREAGVEKLQAAHKEAETALAQLSERMEAEEQHHDKLLKQQAEFAAGTDEYTRKAVEVQVAQLKRQDLSDLYHEARRTPGPEDDVVVARIRDLDGQIRHLEDELRELQRTMRQHHQSYSELEDLRGWFRSKTYDSRWYGLPGGFDLAVLLGQLLNGALSGREIRDRIGREGRFKRRCKPRYRKKYRRGGFDFPSFGGGRRSRRSGRHRGRSGGGGFKTGGSF